MPGDLLENRNSAFRRLQWAEWFAYPGKNEDLAVLVGGDKVVGFSFCKENSDPDAPALGEMHACYIDPAWRGGHTGPLMFIRMMEFLEETHLTPIVIWAFKQNPHRRWYSMMGWKSFLERDREISGYKIPEVGYLCEDIEPVVNRLRQFVSNAHPSN